MSFKQLMMFSFKDEGKKLYGIVLVCVVVLFGVSLFGGKNEQTQKSMEGSRYESANEYIDYYEEKLAALLFQVDGVGKVDVMVTVEQGVERIFVEEKESTNNTSSEKSEARMSEKTLVVSADGKQEPVVIKELAPPIKGVMVVCEGAKSERVKLDIMQGIKTLFHVPMSNICVVQAKK